MPPKKKSKASRATSVRKTSNPIRVAPPKEILSVPKKTQSVTSSLDIDRLVREEVTEWFTSNRKGLEVTFRRVADQVREDIDAIWSERLEEERAKFQAEVRRLAEENAIQRERIRSMEEEAKRMKQILSLVRNQVSDESVD